MRRRETTEVRHIDHVTTVDIIVDISTSTRTDTHTHQKCTSKNLEFCESIGTIATQVQPRQRLVLNEECSQPLMKHVIEEGRRTRFFHARQHLQRSIGADAQNFVPMIPLGHDSVRRVPPTSQSNSLKRGRQGNQRCDQRQRCRW